MLAMNEAGAIANQGEDRKEYTELLVSHHFVPVAIETSVFRQGALIYQGTWVLSTSEDWRAPDTPPPEAKNCCGHAEGNRAAVLGTMTDVDNASFFS